MKTRGESWFITQRKKEEILPVIPAFEVGSGRTEDLNLKGKNIFNEKHVM